MDRPLVESMTPSASGLMATRRLDGELLWRSSSAAELFDQRIEAEACPAQMRGMWSAAARSGAASALVVLDTADGDAGFAVECHLLPAGVAGPEPMLCETYLRAASPGADASLTHDTDLEQVVGHAVIRLDLDGVVRSWSIGAARLKGYRAEDIVGRHFSAFYTPDEAPQRPAMLLAIAVRNGLARDVGWRVRADGSHFWCEVSINALRSPDGEVVGFLKVTRDLTQEKARQTAQERLQRALAHDLRQPLGATYGYLALAREHLAAGEPARADELVARASAALERMGAMLDQLHSSVTRRMNADGGGRPRAMAVPELVAEALGDLSSAHDRARVQQDLRTPTMFIDSVDGIRILTNLLANALRYSSGEVGLRVVDDDETTVITVTDQGRGIHPDDLPTIFELGARGRFAEDSDGGHGDGLTSVRQIVERYHGEVSICSEVEIGTTVSVRLPHERRSPMLTVAADAAAASTTLAPHRTRLEV